MDKLHGTRYNIANRKVSKKDGKRVFLVTVVAKKPLNQSFILVTRTETPVPYQTARETSVRRIRSHKKSAARRYLEEKYER